MLILARKDYHRLLQILELILVERRKLVVKLKMKISLEADLIQVTSVT